MNKGGKYAVIHCYSSRLSQCFVMFFRVSYKGLPGQWVGAGSANQPGGISQNIVIRNLATDGMNTYVLRRLLTCVSVPISGH